MNEVYYWIGSDNITCERSESVLHKKEVHMLRRTYDKIISIFDENSDYCTSEKLYEIGVTVRQINELIDKGEIERVCHGVYWKKKASCGKQKFYKYAEVKMSDSRAVICGASGCFYYGLIKEEPLKVEVATVRTDRSKLNMNFLVDRHYYSVNTFHDGINHIKVENGIFDVFTEEKCIVDCLRFHRNDIDDKVLNEIVDSFNKSKEKFDTHYIKRYSEKLRVRRLVDELLDI